MTETGEWASIPLMAQSAAERFGGAPAVVEGDKAVTYAELGQRIDQAAHYAG